MRKKWFYVDITTTCHERVAVKAVDEEEAKDIAGCFVDGGVIDFAKANEFVMSSVAA